LLAAGDLIVERKKRQGMTLVVPQLPQNWLGL
jgi:hypothetical protein